MDYLQSTPTACHYAAVRGPAQPPTHPRKHVEEKDKRQDYKCHCRGNGLLWEFTGTITQGYNSEYILRLRYGEKKSKSKYEDICGMHVNKLMTEPLGSESPAFRIRHINYVLHLTPSTEFLQSAFVSNAFSYC